MDETEPDTGGRQSEAGLMENSRVLAECTLAIIKPDAVDKEVEIEEIMLQSGFFILQSCDCEISARANDLLIILQQRRKLHLSPEQGSEFYAEHSSKMVFPCLTAHLCSGPLVAILLARHSAIKHWRELLGPPDSEKARLTHPRSLRAIYGTDKIRNALHGSDCFSSAEREIALLFPNTIVEPFPSGQMAEDYLSKYVNKTLQQGLSELCKLKPPNPVVWLADWLLANNPNQPLVQESSAKELPACNF